MKRRAVAALAAALTLVVGTALAAKVSLTGAGSTFVYPLFSKWFAEYNKLHPDVEVNYQSIGSGGGVKQIIEKTIDFGASDAFLSDEELSRGKDILHIPCTIGAVVVGYSVDGVASLKLSPETLACIFLGEIKSWDDARIASENPGVKLPKAAIVVVHRSDGSGTTNVFTDYLSNVSPAWKQKVGTGKSVNWPVGIGGKGNEGVAGQMQQLKGSVGYIELAYALQNKIPTATLRNRDGGWVSPDLASISAAAAGFAEKLPEDLRLSIVNAPGKASYPITGFTYALIYKNQSDESRGRALVDLLWWGIHEGQKLSEPLSYAKLPESIVKKDEAKLRLVGHDGKPFLSGS